MKKPTVLFVDDDPKILHILKRTLTEEPYQVMFAENGHDALAIVDTTEIAVVVADLHMPNMSGLGLLHTVKVSHPEIIRLIFSGDTFSENVLDAINKGEVFRYISKPFYIGEVKVVIRQAIDYYYLNSQRELLVSRIEKIIDSREPDRIKLNLIKALIAEAKTPQFEMCQENSSKNQGN